MAPASHIKVLLVGDFPPPNGGVATHVAELLRAVRERGGECSVLDIGKGQLPAEGVVPAGGVARFSAHLASHAARGCRVHLHTSGANPKSWILAQACALTPAPLITLHSGLMARWLDESPARKAVAKTVLAQYARVIAVSAPIWDALLEAGVESARIEVLPAFSRKFVEPGPPPPGLAELRAEAAPLLCAMVAPRPEYGLAVLLEAFAGVLEQKPRARLALYGPGSESARAAGVRGFGELHRGQALALIAACDTFVRPTLADGDSVSVREALALGRRVVASDVGSRPAGVELVPAGDSVALAAALLGQRAAPAGVAAADSIERILALYQGEAACAASAVS